MRRIASLAALVSCICAVAACRSSSTSIVGPSGSKCAISVPSNLPSIAADGGPGTLSIAVAPECVWSASTESDWISITSSTSGQGDGTVSYVAAGNPTSATRRGTLHISDRRVDLVQTGAPCRYQISPPTAAIGADGGESTVNVVALSGCQWSAVSQAPWITVSAGSTGSGNGTLTLVVASNRGAARVGVVTIGDQTHVISQGPAEASSWGGCVFGIDAPGQSVGASGGAARLAVTTSAGCTWSAASLAPWITVTAGSTGTGTGSVAFTVAPNTGPERVGVVTAAGYTHTVTQQSGASAACSYSLSADGQNLTAAGGTAIVSVTAGRGCSWNASSQTAWITMVAGASGTGDGNIVLAVGPNSGTERTGTIAIAGHTFTVTQAAALIAPVPCTFTVNPTAQQVSAAGGTFGVAVSTQPGCSWAASTTDAWIQLTGGASGTGDGSVQLTVSANSGSPRTGTVAIAGRTLTVTQGAASVPPPVSCTYSISPTTQAIAALGGDFSVAITTQAGCSWTASTDDDWIQLTGGTSGTGSGSVSYRVGLGLLFSRSGRVVIAGQAVTVNQSALLFANDR